MWQDLLADLSPVPGTSTALNLLSSGSGAISNTFGSTAGTCSMIPTDAQLQRIIAAADPNDPAMKRTRERFGRCDCSIPYGGDGKGTTEPASTAIYRAPISVVGPWARHDCSSAGPIRQSLAADLQQLAQRYASAAWGSSTAPAATSLGTWADTGGVAVQVKDPHAGMPWWFWLVAAAGAWFVITGRAGRSLRVLQ